MASMSISRPIGSKRNLQIDGRVSNSDILSGSLPENIRGLVELRSPRNPEMEDVKFGPAESGRIVNNAVNVWSLVSFFIP